MAVLDIELRRIARSFSEVERRIMELIDSEIRPAIAQDGGDVTFVGFEDGLVQLKLIGACGTCPSALTTLRMGIERLLVEEIPEVRGVEQV
jgi:Fe-S cluster biogenesis protein NfuA